jgi:site-specific recombinase XerD
VKFDQAIDRYLGDMKAEGRITSPASERSYRGTLGNHADDIGNRDPRTTGRDDIKRTLRRWPNPNTQRNRRSHLVSFYDWAMQEGIRRDNPARQTRRPKTTRPTVYRMTRAEAWAMLQAASGQRERWAIHLGICAGLRNQELRGLQGRHLNRPGHIWVSPDIGKGGRERWIPIIRDLQPVADEIRRLLEPDDYVLPAQRFRDPGRNTTKLDKRKQPASAQALYYLVGRVGRHAGIAAPIHPHLMRHAFGDHVARHAGIKNAQAMLGHADVATTQGYTGQPTLDELAASVHRLTFAPPTGHPPNDRPARPDKATTGIEPVDAAPRVLEPRPPPGGPHATTAHGRPHHPGRPDRL